MARSWAGRDRGIHLPRSCRVLGVLAAAAVAVPALAADADSARWVSASQLNLRAQPQPGAALVARLRINTPVRLTAPANGRWCALRLVDGPIEGFADCQFLATAPLTLAEVETEVVNTVLALNRLALGAQPVPLPIDWQATAQRQPAAMQALLETLFQQLDRHFALSPSLHTYADADTLLTRLRKALAEDQSAALAPMRQWLSDRLPVHQAMRQTLGTELGRGTWPVVRRAPTSALAALLARRQASRSVPPRPAAADSMAADGEGQPAGPSFFRSGQWAAGWAGGPMAERLPQPGGPAAVYALTYNGFGPWVAADVVEMAKALRMPVRVVFAHPARPDDGAELSQTQPNASGQRDIVTVHTQLPAWGITSSGLVEGQLTQLVFAGDACTGSKLPTAARIVFPRPEQGTLHGAFISSQPVDPARARVAVTQRSWLAPLRDLFENTLTRSTRVRVDLDGDGVPDLRVLVSQDTAVSQGDAAPLRTAWLGAWEDGNGSGDDAHAVRLWPVAGWYANDVFSLEANEDGDWRTLSKYAVVTCT